MTKLTVNSEQLTTNEFIYRTNMTGSVLRIRIKSYEFSIKVVKLYQHLSQQKQEFILSKQLVR